MSAILLAIDPGYTQSAWLEYADGRPAAFGVEPNDTILRVIHSSQASALAIESIASYGMAVGAETFETCVWSGRFIQRWHDTAARTSPWVKPVRRVYRREVKLHLCGSARAKDANVRQALIDLYGPGKDVAIGKKADRGPLFGISSHVWSALAVAVTAADTMTAQREAA